MKKRILILGLILTLVAVVAMPMAVFAASPTNEATVGGTMPGESISVTAPSSIDFGNFVLGMNGPNWATPGSVTAFANTWQVDVTASSVSLMNGTKSLTAPLQISDSASWYNCKAGSTPTFSYINNSTTLPFGAQQMISGPDIALGPGIYTITITFTGMITN